MASKPRELAAIILEKIETEGAYSNLELNAFKAKYQLNEQDHAFLTELVYGVMQQKRLLDFYISPFEKSPENLDNWILQILRIAVYQMVFLDRVPDYAAINEAVNYAKKRGHKGIGSYVNAVLKNIQRHELNDVAKLKNQIKKISIPYSLPDWLVNQFIDQFGETETEKMAQSFNKRAKTTIRVNTNKITMPEAKAELKKAGFETEDSPLSPEGLILKQGLPINHPLYQQALISIQDESSMLIAPALQVEPHHRVLDVCAAPGGKSSHIATFLDADKGGILYSSDIYEHKTQLLEQMVKRQGIESVVKVSQLDATKASEAYDNESFDRILVDAPCSGIGLLRRKPDIRYAKAEETVANLPTLQLDILNEVAPLLKVGGEMVYSTCTILEAENQQVIAAFLAEHPEFELQPIKSIPPFYQDNQGEVTILPHHFDSDGFYLVSLVKISSEKNRGE